MIERVRYVVGGVIVAMLMLLAALMAAPPETEQGARHKAWKVQTAEAHSPFPKWCGHGDMYQPWRSHGYNYGGQGGWQNDGDHFHSISAVKHRNTGNWTGSYPNVKCGHNGNHFDNWPNNQFMG